MREGRRLLLIVVVVAVTAGVILCVRHTRNSRLEERIDNLIQTYEHSHTGATLVELVSLLDQGFPTRRQGGRILSHLTQIEIVTRDSYPSGQSTNIAVEMSLRYQLNNLASRQRAEVFCDVEVMGTIHRQSLSTGSYGITKVNVAGLPEGTHAMTVEHSTILHPYKYETQWSWPSRRSFPASLLPNVYKIPNGVADDKVLYESRACIPLSLTLVDPARAEKVKLLTNPALDAQVRAAFMCRNEPAEPVPDFLSGQMTYPTYVKVSWRNLPCDMIASLCFRKADSTQAFFGGDNGVALQISAGDSADWNFYCTDLMLKEAGSYPGHVVIRPDVDLAYQDPRIKAIWGGTLEFPVTITVTDHPLEPPVESR